MSRRGGGFGFIALIIVLGIILLVAAKNWKAVAPSAMAIHEKNQRRGSASTATEPESFEPSSPSSSGDSWNPTPPSRPSLDAMEQRTSAHTSAVDDALKQTE